MIKNSLIVIAAICILALVFTAEYMNGIDIGEMIIPNTILGGVLGFGAGRLVDL